MGWSAGFEPTNLGATIRCLKPDLANSNILARADGVEPTPTESESVVLPLDYTPK